MTKKRYKYIYGPVPSWRLGSSLGIDPLSDRKKICSFDCIYCQLGKTRVRTKKRKVFIPTEKIIEEIKNDNVNLNLFKKHVETLNENIIRELKDDEEIFLNMILYIEGENRFYSHCLNTAIFWCCAASKTICRT